MVLTEPVTFLHAATPAPVLIELPSHLVAVYSAPDPNKDTANEDAAVVLSAGPSTVVVAVADGAGGYGSGDVASRSAVTALCAAFARRDELPVRARILNAFEQAHGVIAADGLRAATTLVAAEIDGQALRTFHAGDSGVLAAGGRGRLKLQTVLHSPTGYGVEAGLLNEDEAMHHDERHMVSNLLGMEPMSVTMGSPLTLAVRDTVVIASDGLFDNLYAAEICERIRRGSAEQACGDLAAAATARMHAAEPGMPSKPDDLTIAVIRVKR